MNAAEELELEQRSQTAAVVATFVAVILLLIGTRLAISSRETVHWPTASATVIGAELSRSGNRQRFSWVPVIAYEYEVEGRRYRSGRIYHGVMNAFKDKARAEAWLARHALGATLTIHYDPDDPSEAVLYPQTSPIAWLLIGLGVLALIVAAVTRQTSVTPAAR